jgi:predicted nucleic acid-binding protein
MILYLDTSALVKRYFRETHTGTVIKKWRQASEIVTSSVAYAEALAAFCRKQRESEFNNTLMNLVVKDLRADWASFIRIQVNDELNAHVDEALRTYPLRGFNAIHLASAMIIYAKFQKELLFICFDKQLNAAAKNEGMQTLS